MATLAPLFNRNIILNAPIYDIECRYFTTGNCWYGHHCRYKHIQSSSSITMSHLMSSQQTMQSQIKQILLALGSVRLPTTATSPQNRTDTSINTVHPITGSTTQNRSKNDDDEDRKLLSDEMEKKCNEEIDRVLAEMKLNDLDLSDEEPQKPEIKATSKPLKSSDTQSTSSPTECFINGEGKNCRTKSRDRYIFNNTEDNKIAFYSWIFAELTGGIRVSNDKLNDVVSEVRDEMEDCHIYTGYYTVQTFYDALDSHNIKYRKIWPVRYDD